MILSKTLDLTSPATHQVNAKQAEQSLNNKESTSFKSMMEQKSSKPIENETKEPVQLKMSKKLSSVDKDEKKEPSDALSVQGIVVNQDSIEYDTAKEVSKSLVIEDLNDEEVPEDVALDEKYNFGLDSGLRGELLVKLQKEIESEASTDEIKAVDGNQNLLVASVVEAQMIPIKSKMEDSSQATSAAQSILGGTYFTKKEVNAKVSVEKEPDVSVQALKIEKPENIKRDMQSVAVSSILGQSKSFEMPVELKVESKPVQEDFASALKNSLSKVFDMFSTSSKPNVEQLNGTPAQSSIQSNVISGQLGSSRWNQEVGQKVVWMVGGLDKSATLTLNPPELGPLKVVVSVNNDKADVTFSSNNPEVRVALENGTEKLREMMKSAGIELGQSDVRDGFSRGESNQKQQQPEFRNQNGFTGNKPLADLIEGDSRVVASKTKERDGLINTFA